MARRGSGGHSGGGGGGHDGAGSMRWLLTYADLITLLMVFFIVLYSISELNQSKYIALSNAIRAAFALQADSGNAAISTSPIPSLDASNLPQTGSQNGLLRAVGAQVLDKVESQHVQQAVSVLATPQGLRISFQAKAIFFAKDSATITPAFQRLLLAIAPILRPLPNQIQVQGYTDNEPNPKITSWDLSAARALNVLQFLVHSGGLPPTRVSAVAYGQYHPLYSNATTQGQARNRSVDLLITAGTTQPPAQVATGSAAPTPATSPAAGTATSTATSSAAGPATQPAQPKPAAASAPAH